MIKEFIKAAAQVVLTRRKPQPKLQYYRAGSYKQVIDLLADALQLTAECRDCSVKLR